MRVPIRSAITGGVLAAAAAPAEAQLQDQTPVGRLGRHPPAWRQGLGTHP